MKADPAALAFVSSVLAGLSAKERETLLAPYAPHSSPARVAAGPRPLLTTAEACDLLRCSRTTLHREEKAGRLAAVWVRGKKLFRVEDLNAALRQGEPNE
jgi:excisionase family DNA binding protein